MRRMTVRLRQMRCFLLRDTGVTCQHYYEEHILQQVIDIWNLNHCRKKKAVPRRTYT